MGEGNQPAVEVGDNEEQQRLRARYRDIVEQITRRRQDRPEPSTSYRPPSGLHQAPYPTVVSVSQHDGM